MKTKMTFAAALLAATTLGGGAYAKSLVYCSEGSPENFTPAMNTTGTSLRRVRPSRLQPPCASSRPAAPRKSNRRWLKL